MHDVVTQFISAGDVAAYATVEARLQLAAPFAAASGVDVGDVVVEVSSASVNVRVRVRVASRTAAHALSAKLRPHFRSSSLASGFLAGAATVERVMLAPMAVVSVGLLPVPMPAAPPSVPALGPATAAAQSAAQSTEASSTSLYSPENVLIVAVAGGALLVGLLVGLLCFAWCRRRLEKPPDFHATGTRRRGEAGAFVGAPARQQAHHGGGGLYATSATEMPQLQLYDHHQSQYESRYQPGAGAGGATSLPPRGPHSPHAIVLEDAKIGQGYGKGMGGTSFTAI